MSADTIKPWQSYIKRGAPTNAAGAQSGIGRTKQEASADANHWQNQAAWEGFRRVQISNESETSPFSTESETLAWSLVEWLESTLPPTQEGKRILQLMKKRQFATAVLEYFAARDAGIDLVRL